MKLVEMYSRVTKFNNESKIRIRNDVLEFFAPLGENAKILSMPTITWDFEKLAIEKHNDWQFFGLERDINLSRAIMSHAPKNLVSATSAYNLPHRAHSGDGSINMLFTSADEYMNLAKSGQIERSLFRKINGAWLDYEATAPTIAKEIVNIPFALDLRSESRIVITVIANRDKMNNDNDRTSTIINSLNNSGLVDAELYKTDRYVSYKATVLVLFIIVKPILDINRINASVVDKWFTIRGLLTKLTEKYSRKEIREKLGIPRITLNNILNKELEDRNRKVIINDRVVELYKSGKSIDEIELITGHARFTIINTLKKMDIFQYPRNIDVELLRKVDKLLDDGHTIKEIANILNCDYRKLLNTITSVTRNDPENHLAAKIKNNRVNAMRQHWSANANIKTIKQMLENGKTLRIISAKLNISVDAIRDMINNENESEILRLNELIKLNLLTNRRKPRAAASVDPKEIIKLLRKGYKKYQIMAMLNIKDKAFNNYIKSLPNDLHNEIAELIKGNRYQF